MLGLGVALGLVLGPEVALDPVLERPDHQLQNGALKKELYRIITNDNKEHL